MLTRALITSSSTLTFSFHTHAGYENPRVHYVGKSYKRIVFKRAVVQQSNGQGAVVAQQYPKRSRAGAFDEDSRPQTLVHD